MNPNTLNRPKVQPQPCWLCGSTEYHWRDECPTLKWCMTCSRWGHRSNDSCWKVGAEYELEYPNTNARGNPAAGPPPQQGKGRTDFFPPGKGKGQEKGEINQGKGAAPPPPVQGKGLGKGGKGGQ